MFKQLKIAMIQMDSKFGNVDLNLRKAEKFILQAAHENAKIICLPESFSYGFSFSQVDEMAKHGETIGGETLVALSKLAKENKVYIIAPLILSVGIGISENTAVLINDEGIIEGKYAKTHTIGMEQLHFKRGRKYPVFKTKYGTIGILICYDMVFPETARLISLQNAEIIFFPSAWRDKLNYKLMWEINLISRALDNTIFTVGVNRTGEMDGINFSGGSMVVNPKGETIFKAGREEGVFYVDICLKDVLDERWLNTALIDRHPEDYLSLCD